MPIIDPDYVPPIALTFDEGKPIRSEQGLLLAGNPIAMFLGKVGAPRLQLAFALDTLVAGDVVRWREDAVKSGAIGEPIGAFGIGFLQDGTARFSFEHRHTSGTSNVVFSRWRNGVVTAVATFANTASFVARTIDVTLVRGDYYSLLNTPEAGTQASLQNCRISTTGMRIWPFPQFAWDA